jgi:hypothetical protein
MKIMSKNVVEPERPQMAIWRCVACWISKATHAQAHTNACCTHTHKHTHTHTHTGTHTHALTRKHKYAILIACPRQEWFRERASVLRYAYIACLFSLYGHDWMHLKDFSKAIWIFHKLQSLSAAAFLGRKHSSCLSWVGLFWALTLSGLVSDTAGDSPTYFLWFRDLSCCVIRHSNFACTISECSRLVFYTFPPDGSLYHRLWCHWVI